MRKLLATFCAIQSCMALTLIPHDTVFHLEVEEENVEVSIDINNRGDAVLAIQELGQVMVSIKDESGWSKTEVVPGSLYADSIEVKIDDEGNAALFCESERTLFGSKRENGVWLLPEHIIKDLPCPYGINSRGEILYLERSTPFYRGQVYLNKKTLGSTVSQQLLGPIEDGDYYVEGAIAKNLSGNHLFLWRDSVNGKMQLYFVFEKDGVLTPPQIAENLFLDLKFAWDIKAAYGSNESFCLLGTGRSESTNYNRSICGTRVEEPGSYHSQILALDDDVENIAIAIDPNNQILVVWEGKEGISTSTLSFDRSEEVKAPAPSLFLEKVSIKNGDVYFQPDPQGGFTLVWQQSLYDRENRTIEYAIYACRFDSSRKEWTESERLTPVGTQAFMKGFTTAPNGERLVVWCEWIDEDVQLRVGSLN